MATLAFRIVIPGVADISVFDDSTIEGAPDGAFWFNHIPLLQREAFNLGRGQQSETLHSSAPRSGPRSTS